MRHWLDKIRPVYHVLAQCRILHIRADEVSLYGTGRYVLTTYISAMECEGDEARDHTDDGDDADVGDVRCRGFRG